MGIGGAVPEHDLRIGERLRAGLDELGEVHEAKINKPPAASKWAGKRLF